ncbi:hypothetical protein [Staphylococcus aureus]|uniref:hypothetical protein n=1 Tax=Staphylococcus aureus TaxID=1280 RepID=UPI0011D20C65|nr:hypothetical protein [Staphylococcus aureus]
MTLNTEIQNKTNKNIKWAWDNLKLSGNKRFYSYDVERNCFVNFHVVSILCNVTGYVSINDKFTVQEEI